MSVCVSVREHISETTLPNPNFTKFSVHAASGSGSVLLRWRCDVTYIRFCG